MTFKNQDGYYQEANYNVNKTKKNNKKQVLGAEIKQKITISNYAL